MKKEYLSNQDLLDEIIKSKQQDELTKTATIYFQIMIENIGTRLKYKNRMDLDDCKQEAFLNILKYWKKFDETKTTNAFSYFTQVIKTGYAIGFNKYYKKKLRTFSIRNFEENDLV